MRIRYPDMEELKEHGWNIRRDALVDSELMYSPAFNSLTKTSMYVLIRFLQKRTFSMNIGGTRLYNNHNLVFTYSEAEALGISRSQFKRSIAELMEMGFIELERQGGSLSKVRDHSRYGLVDSWEAFGTARFVPKRKRKQGHKSYALQRYNDERKYSQAIWWEEVRG